MNWFYAIDGQQSGPVTFAEIERLYAEGQLTEDSLVWQQGQPNWVKLSTVLPTATEPPVVPPVLAPAPAVAPVPVTATDLVTKAKTNTLAIVSLVCGIIGLLCCGIIVGPAAAICGHIALNQIKADPLQSGRGLAIAGLILGYVAIVMSIIFLALYGSGIYDEILKQQTSP